MAPRVLYNNQGLVSQAPVRLMYPRSVSPLEQARFQQRTGMDYQQVNPQVQRQFGYQLSPIGDTSAPVYTQGMVPEYVQGAINAYDRAFPSLDTPGLYGTYGAATQHALGLTGLMQPLIRTWGPAALRTIKTGMPVVNATANALKAAAPSVSFLPTGVIPTLGALGAGLLHAARWTAPRQQIAAAQRMREQAVRNSFVGVSPQARAGRILYNLGDQMDRVTDAVGTAGGILTANPWSFLLSNGSTSAMVRSYKDALNDKGNTEEQSIRNSIWNAMPWYERLGGGSVSENLEPAAYSAYVNRGKFDPARYKAWYAAQQSRGMDRKSIMRAREDLVRKNPLYFDSGISDADRGRSSSELYQQAMKQEYNKK